MKVMVACPNGHQFKVEDAHIGKHANCPHKGCGVRFTLATANEHQPVWHAILAKTPPQPRDERQPLQRPCTEAAEESQQTPEAPATETVVAGRTSEPAAEATTPLREPNLVDFLAPLLCIASLVLLAASTLMNWVSLLSGGVSGISGDGKFIAALACLLALLVAGALALRRMLPLTLLATSCAGTICLFWMVSLIYRISVMKSAILDDDNVFAQLFVSQVNPGTGLYVGAVASIGVIVSALSYECIVAVGNKTIKTWQIWASHSAAATIGLLWMLLLAQSGIDSADTTDRATRNVTGLEESSAIDASNVRPGLQDERRESSAKDWELVSVDSRVTESNDTWWRYSWKLTIRNTGSRALSFSGKIKFLDAQEFIVDTDSFYRKPVGPEQSETFSGFALIPADVAPNVKGVVAEVKQN